MQFESDIFISYAHIDNATVVDGQEGWVTTLHRALELRVTQLMGEKPKIFRDPKLQGNDYFEDTLVDQLPKTAVLVSVFSPRYVKSEWCSRELLEFVNASAESGGLRLADKARVFKVLKTPVPPEAYPESVKPLLGYEFFKKDPETGRIRELDKVFGPEAQSEFWLKLDDLAHDLAELLEAMHQQGEPSAAPSVVSPGEPVRPERRRVERRQSDRRHAGRATAAPPQETEKAVVFLAQTTSDLKAEHEAVMRDLKQAGHEVLPEASLPLEAEELETFASEQLARCRLSVHLIGRKYGVVPEGAKRSLAAVQNDLAIERGEKGGFQRLVWIPPGLEVEGERQKEFVEKLRSDPRIQQGADLLEVPLEDLKTEIHGKLEPPPEPEPEPELEVGDRESPVASGSGGVHIYVICDQRDSDKVTAVADYLFDRGYDVTLPAFEGDEAEVREEHEENLRACDAALIYWGEGNDLWLRRKLRELKKALGLGREAPWRAEGVLLAPPESDEKEGLRTHDFVVLRQAGEDFSPDTLKPFLAALENGADGP